MNPTSAMLPGIDPPRHVQYRKLINQGFTARNVQRLEPHMRKVARDIVADVTEKGEFDAVPDISAEMSLQVIADVLGVPAEDRMEVFRWSNAIGSLGIEDPDYAPTPEALGQAAAEMFSYCNELVEHRRKHGLTDDILSALLAAEVDGEKLNRDQLNEFFLLLAIAGNETTRNTLSHGILALSRASRTTGAAGPRSRRPSRAPSRNCCAGRPRSCTSAAPSPRTSRSAGSRSPRATGC